jgi:hypothetical protein
MVMLTPVMRSTATPASWSSFAAATTGMLSPSVAQGFAVMDSMKAELRRPKAHALGEKAPGTLNHPKNMH